MRTLILGRRFAVRTLPVVLLPLLAPGCGWKRTMRSISPSQKAAVEIWQTRDPLLARARVELVTGHRRAVLCSQDDEALIHFVHVYWTPDEKRVAVLVSGLLNCEAAAEVETGE